MCIGTKLNWRQAETLELPAPGYWGYSSDPRYPYPELRKIRVLILRRQEQVGGGIGVALGGLLMAIFPMLVTGNLEASRAACFAIPGGVIFLAGAGHAFRGFRIYRQIYTDEKTIGRPLLTRLLQECLTDAEERHKTLDKAGPEYTPKQRDHAQQNIDAIRSYLIFSDTP